MNLHKIISARHRSEKAFVSTWRTTSASETITLPTPTNYLVDWGDGVITTDANSHQYAIAGDYEIKIRGDINNFIFNNGGDKDKIISIENAGGLILTGDSFNGCSNLEYLKGELKKPSASLGDCFKGCSVFNSDLLSLDTSDTIAITAAFREATLFNGDISNWNTSNATSIGSLFYQASSFDGDLSLWDVSKVTNMSSAFFSASSFSGDLSSWITTSLINCASVFLDATSFNSDIGGWDVSNVTQMQNMLRSTSFNYPLNLWDTSSVVNMQLMFAGTTSFNQPLDSWSFVSVTNMNGFMTSKTDTDYNSNYLSDLLIKLDQDLVFANMVNVNLGFGTIKYDSTGVTAYNSLVSKGFIIQSGGLLQEFVSIWRTTSASETITLPTPTNYLVDWGDGVITTDANSHIYAITGDYEIKIRGEITDYRFNDTGDKLKILEISNFGGLNLLNACFFGCENLSFIDDNYNVFGTSLGSSFRGCTNLNSPMLSLNTNGVTVLSATFRDSILFNQDLNHLDTSSVTSIASCFYEANSFNGDISSWDVSNVESISTAFFRASSFNGDLSSWVTTLLTNCSNAFQDATSFNSDIGGWDVSNVLFMNAMFRNTAFNHPLNLWDTSKVQTMSLMFFLTPSFNQPLDSWSFVSVTNMSNFMLLKTENDYDANYLSDLLIKLDQDLVFANMVNVNLGFGTIKYDSTGVTAYNSLVSKGFIIQSGGQV